MLRPKMELIFPGKASTHARVIVIIKLSLRLIALTFERSPAAPRSPQPTHPHLRRRRQHNFLKTGELRDNGEMSILLRVESVMNDYNKGMQTEPSFNQLCHDHLVVWCDVVTETIVLR